MTSPRQDARPNKQQVISTKLWVGGDGVNDRGCSRKHIIEGMRRSLKRLKLEYVDLVYCHRYDVGTPLEETVRAMNFLIDQGMAYYWGTSMWTPAEIIRAREIAKRLNLVGPVMEQPVYNLFEREIVELHYAGLYSGEAGGLGLTVWSPLAQGVLAGRYLECGSGGSAVPADSRAAFAGSVVADEQKLKCAHELKAVADRLGVSLAQLSLAWVLKNPNVSTAIIGASKVAQIEDNVGAVECVGLITDEVEQEIQQIVGFGEPEYPKELSYKATMVDKMVLEQRGFFERGRRDYYSARSLKMPHGLT